MKNKKTKQPKYGIYVHNTDKGHDNGKNYWAFADLLEDYVAKILGEWDSITNQKGEFASNDINLAYKYLNIIEKEQDKDDKDILEVKVRK